MLAKVATSETPNQNPAYCHLLRTFEGSFHSDIYITSYHIYLKTKVFIVNKMSLNANPETCGMLIILYDMDMHYVLNYHRQFQTH